MKHLYCFLLLVVLFTDVHAQTLLKQFPIPNAPVRAITRSGNTVFLGGDFSAIGPSIPFGTAVDNGGVANPSFAKPNGSVLTSIPDGQGGWFIGGRFTTVGGQPRNIIARINADGSLNPWNANADLIYAGGISSMALSGNTLYVTGTFSSIGGQPRASIAALDVNTGLATAWNPGTNSFVMSMLLLNNTIYIGGYFTTIGGISRPNFGAIDATTGAVLPWNPQPGGGVLALATDGVNIYLGGSFANPSPQAPTYIKAFNIATGAPVTWNAPIGNDGPVNALVVSNNTLYMGGGFQTVGGQSRIGIAAVELTNHSLLGSFSANVNNGAVVNSLTLSGSNLYVGGSFSTIGGQSRNRIARINAATGAVDSWNPNANNSVLTTSISNGVVYAGGNFTSINQVSRQYIAAVNATTGEILAWNPGTNGSVYDIAVAGDTVFLAGGFTSVSTTQPQVAFGAVRFSTGAVVPWTTQAGFFGSPIPGKGYALKIDGNTLYVGGWFQTLAGNVRGGGGAFTISTMTQTSWDPKVSMSPNPAINHIEIGANMVLISGNFLKVGTENRSYFATVDKVNGIPQILDVNSNNVVNASAVIGNTVYLAGVFNSIGGQTRNRLAAFDLSTNALLPWNPDANATATTLTTNGTELYAGGNFTVVNGTPRNGVAQLNTQTGAVVNTWNADLTGSVYRVFTETDRVYLGGPFTFVKAEERPNFAVLQNASNAPLPVQWLSFNGKPVESATGYKVELNWSTAAEVNCLEYAIERSADGRQYENIGTVTAAGTTSNIQAYKFIDDRPLHGNSFYRLRQVDKDGSYSYSKVVMVSIATKGFVVHVYPNPVRNAGSVLVTSADQGLLSYSIYDVAGRNLVHGQYTVVKGSNRYDIQLSQLSSGTYHLVLRMNDEIKTITLVKE